VPDAVPEVLPEAVPDAGADGGRSRWAVPALAAAAVIAVVAAGALGQALRPTGTPEDEAPDAPGIRRTVPFDRGPLSSDSLAEEVERCVGGQSRPSDYRVEYSRMVDAPHGRPVSAVVLTARDTGATGTCVDGTLSTATATATADAALEPDEEHPVVVADPGGDVVSTDPGDSTVTSWFTQSWYRVSPAVAWVATRVGTEDGNEPWRVSPARDGWVYAATWWTDTRYDADDEVRVESVAYDAQGKVIDAGDVLAPRLVDTGAAS
jgi:hypothetical protein